MTISPAGLNSALAALQSLQVQTQDATGSVAATTTALAPSSTAFTIAAGNQPTDPLKTLALGLSQGASLTDAAGAVAQSVGDLLQQLQATATNASQTGLSSAGRASLTGQFLDQLGQITGLLNQASVNGQNLINGSLTANPTVATEASGAGQISLPLADLSLGGPIISLSAGASVATASVAAVSADLAGQSAKAVDDVVQKFFGLSDQLNSHAGTVNTVAAWASDPNTDSSGDSARLAALQVKQALTGQSGSLASPASQSILSLFRGQS